MNLADRPADGPRRRTAEMVITGDSVPSRRSVFPAILLSRRKGKRKRILRPVILLCICLLSVGYWTYLVVSVESRRSPERTGLGTVISSSHLKRESSSLASAPEAIDRFTKDLPEKRWFMIGIVRDAKEVQDSTWDALAHVACTVQPPVQVHLTVGGNKQYGMQQLVAQRVDIRQRESNHPCAKVYVETEQELGTSFDEKWENRVDRIAAIRNAQRQRVHQLWLKDRSKEALLDQDIVIVADMDLYRLPPLTSVISQASIVAEGDKDVDVVCAAGVTMASRNELWYYDTYATVFLPDTYVHPLKRRLVQEYYPGENKSLVRSDDQHGSFTQGDIMRYLQQQASLTGTVQVRSCFGGLTIYRASTWFQKECSYIPHHDPSLLVRYASAHDGRPCEHVVLHTCLQDTPNIQKAHIAINPSMMTLWKKN